MASSLENITYEELEKIDVISVELVPERKGLILKHCEYYVSSRRYGTTVTRRYNEFAQLCDVLHAKYPYRAICRLPPKRVVVNGGSPRFLQRRRAALQRWLTLVARHPLVAHDADLRAFLCESNAKFEKPKHDEFMLAGSQDSSGDMLTEEMQAACASEQDHLRLVQLGLERLLMIFDKVEGRVEAERADLRELGAGLLALASPSPPSHTAADTALSAQWDPIRAALKKAASIASKSPIAEATEEDGPTSRFLLAVDCLSGHSALTSRVSRGAHAELSAAASSSASPASPAAAAAAASPAARALRARQRFALVCQLQEARVARAYSLAAVQSLPEVFGARASSRALLADLWTRLYQTLKET